MKRHPNYRYQQSNFSTPDNQYSKSLTKKGRTTLTPNTCYWKSLSMKISWTSLKVSIAGAKLSHLVQKDQIWDHGSMTEQARIAFHVLVKAMNTHNFELLTKYCTTSCFEKLKTAMNSNKSQNFFKAGLVIKELVVISVHEGKNYKPDMFTALIKGDTKNYGIANDHKNKFSTQCSFVRRGDWWILDRVRS